MPIEQQIYNKLNQLIHDIKNTPDYIKSVSDVFMDLNLDVLVRGDDVLRIALSHYYKHDSGDMIPDPDMEIEINLLDCSARALTFQNAFRFDSVEQGDEVERLQESLNQFLLFWLKKLVLQGHQLGFKG